LESGAAGLVIKDPFDLKHTTSSPTQGHNEIDIEQAIALAMKPIIKEIGKKKFYDEWRETLEANVRIEIARDAVGTMEYNYKATHLTHLHQTMVLPYA